MIKKCTKCNIEKELNEFPKNKDGKNGLRSYCKDCLSKCQRKYYQKNKGIAFSRQRKYYQKNKEEINKKQRKYYQKNKEVIDKRTMEYYCENKEKICEQVKEHRQQNLEKVHKRCNKYYEINKQNPQFRLSVNISSSIYKSLRGNKNGRHWENIMNCILQDLKNDMESKFTDNMSWDNYGDWHIHHKIPISLWQFESYNDREFKQCWALCNLEPMWAEENMSRHNRIL